MKSITYLLTFICLTGSLLGASIPNLEIRLQGDYNFEQVITESEDQLDINIILPSKLNSKSSRAYNQIISLQQLSEAIVHQFAQNDIPLIYSFSKGKLEFKRSDIPKTTKTRTYAPKPTPKKTTKPSKIPTISQPPVESEKPTLPNWANRAPQQIPAPVNEIPVLSNKGVTPPSNNSASTSLPTDLEDPFEFNIPTRKTFNPTTPKPKVAPQKPYTPPPVVRQPAPPVRETAPSNAERYEIPKRFGITPYPDGAVAFINDAPSIVPGAAKENYIEWQTRMQGAVENSNINVLKNERIELERRMRWLDRQLP